jgi:hypothetical protein
MHAGVRKNPLSSARQNVRHCRAEALLERERSNGGLLSLLLERFGHADEAEGDEPVVCRM